MRLFQFEGVVCSIRSSLWGSEVPVKAYWQIRPLDMTELESTLFWRFSCSDRLQGHFFAKP